MQTASAPPRPRSSPCSTTPTAGWPGCGLGQDPVFGFDGAELLAPSGPFEFGLTLSLTLPVSGRLDVERSRDEAAYDSERLRVAAAEWEVRVAVRRAWASWRAATERVRLIEATLEEVALIGEAAERLARAGEMSRAEARLFRAEHVSLRAEQAAAVEATEQARLGLLEQMGLSPESGVTLAEDEPLPIGAVTHDPDRVAETSPAVAVLLAAYAVAEQSLRLEVRRQYPDLEIGGGVGSEDDDERLLLGLSLPIPAFNGNRRGIAEARAARELARVAVEVELERLRFRLAEASRRERSVRARRELLASELDPILDEQAAELDRLAELGEIDTLLMLETVTRRLSAKQQLLDLRLAEQLAAIDIAGLTGPNASTPSPGPPPPDRPAP